MEGDDDDDADGDDDGALLSMGMMGGCWTPLMMLSPHCSPTLSCGTPLLGASDADAYADDDADNQQQSFLCSDYYFDILKEVAMEGGEGDGDDIDEGDDCMGCTVPAHWMSPDCSDSCETAVHPLRSVA